MNQVSNQIDYPLLIYKSFKIMDGKKVVAILSLRQIHLYFGRRIMKTVQMAGSMTAVGNIQQINHMEGITVRSHQILKLNKMPI